MTRPYSRAFTYDEAIFAVAKEVIARFSGDAVEDEVVKTLAFTVSILQNRQYEEVLADLKSSINRLQS